MPDDLTDLEIAVLCDLPSSTSGRTKEPSLSSSYRKGSSCLPTTPTGDTRLVTKCITFWLSVESVLAKDYASAHDSLYNRERHRSRLGHPDRNGDGRGRQSAVLRVDAAGRSNSVILPLEQRFD